MALDYPSIIAAESARLAAILRTGPLDARVPGTPDWSLGELGVHLVGVQRWATGVIVNGEAREVDQPPPAPEDAAEALDASAAALLAAIDAADPDAPCWNFTSAPQTTGFWFRRQALEATVHAWDGASAVTDEPHRIDTAIAADVIDEFVTTVLARVIAREGIDTSDIVADVHVHCTDTGELGVDGEWTFEVVDGSVQVTKEHRKAAIAIRGPASDLALFLYNRLPRDVVEIFGEDAALEAWSPVFAA